MAAALKSLEEMSFHQRPSNLGTPKNWEQGFDSLTFEPLVSLFLINLLPNHHCFTKAFTLRTQLNRFKHSLGLAGNSSSVGPCPTSSPQQSAPQSRALEGRVSHGSIRPQGSHRQQVDVSPGLTPTRVGTNVRGKREHV